jgi:signal transduction histidine kinase/CheY-like chemotaxis protein
MPPRLSKRSSKIATLVGFSLVLLLLSAVVILATVSISNNRLHLTTINEEQQEITSVFGMRDAALQRSLMLYRIVQVPDPFERDELYMRFREKGEVFLKSREFLVERMDQAKLGTLQDKELWDTINIETARSSAVHNATVNHLFSGEVAQAQTLLLNEVYPAQDALLVELKKMVDLRYAVINNELKQANQNNTTYFIAILMLGITAFFTGIGVTYYVVKHNVATEGALLQQQAAAEAASQAKSLFLANMSHEIRTPLTAIVGFSECLQDTHLTQTDRNNAEDAIIRNGKHLQQMLNDILDLSKIEADQLQVEILETSPIQIAIEVDSIVRKRALDKGLAFKLDYHLPLPKTITTDVTRLKQILINLCSNSIKFTPAGEIVLRLSYLQSNNSLSFEVIDTGIGMSPQELQQLFKPFTQADASTTRKYGGTGLGLSISQQLAIRLGGELTCTSQKDAGSSFRLTLQLDANKHYELLYDLADYDQTQHEFDNLVEIPQLHGKILLAEDSPDNQQLIGMYIRKTGAELTIVNNGQQAIDAALAHDYDLILMDMQMPVMDGVEATSLLRQAGYTKPIVSLTANALLADKQKCLAAGASDFLAKPIHRQKFYTLLTNYLRTAAKLKTAVVSDDLACDQEYQEIVQRFIRRLPEFIQEIQTATAAQQWDVVQSVSHKLKGMGGGFGYPEITQLAEEINTLVIGQQVQTLPLRIANLAHVCQTIVQNNAAAS